MKSSILTIFPGPGERPNVSRPQLTPGSQPQSSALASLNPTINPTALPSIESVILQKLLVEIEARQLTPVRPTYVIEQPAPLRNATLIRALWSAVWVLSIVVCVLAVKYSDTQNLASKADAFSTRSLENLTTTISDQKKDFSRVIDSLQGLANAIATNSQRTARIPEIVARLGSNLASIRPPLVRERVDLSPQPEPQSVLPQLWSAPTFSQQDPDAVPIPMGGHHHPPIEFAVAPSDVVVHHNAVGFMDYWFVPRTVSGVRSMVKVVPVSQSDAGTLVHGIDEANDYLVTPSGDWIPALAPATNQ